MSLVPRRTAEERWNEFCKLMWEGADVKASFERACNEAFLEGGAVEREKIVRRLIEGGYQHAVDLAEGK